MDIWTIWLIVSGIFFIIEMLTISFLFFWLGVAALLAMLVSFFIDSIAIQITVFAIFSVLLIFSTKPLVKKFLDKKTIVTNAVSLVGKKGIVIQEIDSIKGIGQVKVNGEVWSAKCADDINIAKDEEVEVEEIIGVKLVVKRAQKTEEAKV